MQFASGELSNRLTKKLTHKNFQKTGPGAGPIKDKALQNDRADGVNQLGSLVPEWEKPHPQRESLSEKLKKVKKTGKANKEDPFVDDPLYSQQNQKVSDFENSNEQVAKINLRDWVEHNALLIGVGVAIFGLLR